MKSLFKLLAFTLVFSMILHAAFPLSLETALIVSAGVNLITYNFVQIPSSFGYEFITAGSDYKGGENQDILFRPRFNGKVEDVGFRQIFTNRRGSTKVTFFGKLAKILMPYAKGFQGGDGAPIKQKKFELAEFKAEVSYDKHDYFDIIQEQMVNIDGVNQNDISGTDVMAAEQKVFMDALQSDVHRNVWLGDTSKTHTVDGTYPDGTAYSSGDADKFYNQIDGVITQIRAKSDLSPSASAEEILLNEITAGGIQADEAGDIFKAMFRKAPKVLRALKNTGMLRYYVTDSVLYKYLDDLEADGTEAARTQTINGITYPTYDGIPIQVLNIDTYIEDDFAASFPDDLIILTTPMNMAMVLNAASGFAETRLWFNADENENRQRTQFHMGSGYVLPELISFAQNASA
jgi:hypothetical protein